MRPVALHRWMAVAAVALGTLLPSAASAQNPPHFYWKSLSDSNAVPFILESISGNSNPADPAHIVAPGGTVSGTLGMAGYARTFSLFDRSATASLIVPMGNISGSVTVGGRTFQQFALGFGDPMAEFDLNVIGPKAQKTFADVGRYEPGFSMDVMVDLAFPIGQYDSSQPLNLGQHRWYGRIGLPIVWQLGPWIPGDRMTLEFLPAVWWFTNNTNYLDGQTLSTNVLFEIDGHLTRDLTSSFWAAIDGAWLYGGMSAVDGVAGDLVNNFGVGFTLGWRVTSSLALMGSYMAILGNGTPNSLRMDRFSITLAYGWNSLVEGVQRLEGNK